MSNSETHSEKAVSDEEDFKASIQYLDEATGRPVSTPSTDDYEQLAHILEDVDGGADGEGVDGDAEDEDGDGDAESNSVFGGYSNWEHDDGFMDDNLSRVGSDYSGYSTSESTSFYASPHQLAQTPQAIPSLNPNPNPNSNANPVTARPAMAGAAACYDPRDRMREGKYCSGEMLLRPPSTTMLSYNYPAGRSMPPPALGLQHPFVPPSTQPSSSAAAAHHGQVPGTPYGAYGAQHPPNMWYPNAPYGSGSGGYGPYGAHRYAQHYGSPGGYPADHPMMDMLQLTNSGREARNRAEKNRRDKLNGSIQELSTMVPHVAESPRRVDKTAVLRFAAHGLRLQYVFGDTLNQRPPQVTDTLMKLLDSFFITITCHGQIVLMSASIEQHLGHCQADLYGQNILHIAHPEDHNMLKQELIPSDLESLFEMQPSPCGESAISTGTGTVDDDSEGGDCRQRTRDEEDYIDRKLREDRRSFTVRLARASPRSEPTSYELVKMEGNFRRADWAPRGAKSGVFPSSLQLIRRTRGRDDAIPLHTISGNDIVLIAIARIVRPPKIVSNVMDNNLEYWTRHLIDGRIINCDQRIGIVAGYMTSEVQNLSPFTFIHQDDVRWVMVALRQMYDCSSSPGESTYRLITRNGNFIYLQSKGYLEIDKKTNKVHSFLCVNTLMDEAEGRRRVDDMKTRFSVIIDEVIDPTLGDLPASENPLQIERAVFSLLKDLHQSKSSSDDERDALSPPSGSRSTRTPPLSLVPPEASTVKTSISTSIKLINVTAGKRLREKQRLKMQQSAESEAVAADSVAPNASPASAQCSCQGGMNEEECDHCAGAGAGAGAGAANERLAAPSAAEGNKRSSAHIDGSMHTAMPKRRNVNTDMDPAQIGRRLNLLGRKLDEQVNVALELRDQCSKYEVPNTNQRIDEIMEEHLKQSEIYVNIKTEYEMQLNATPAVAVAADRAPRPPVASNEDDDGYHEEEGDSCK